MKKLQFRFLVLLPFLLTMLVFCVSTGTQKSGQRTLTIGAMDKLASTLPGNITWTSSDEDIVSVNEEGYITAAGFTDFQSGTGSAVITATAENGRTQSFTINTTMTALVDMLELPPMKDQFKDYFPLFGNIVNPRDIGSSGVTNERLLRHYNVLTAENDMKPDKLSPSRGSYNFSTADRLVNAAIESGFQVIGHTLLWHSQIPQWQASLRTNDTSPELALQYMKDFITSVVSHFRGRIHTWDVINEAFPDGGYTASSNWREVMRQDRNGNPWYMKIGADFVYEAFLAARLADPGAILYYNDFNLDQRAKARMVHDMVRDVNARYRQTHPAETRLLIEGIGMQSHHNTNVSPANVRNTLSLFRELGVRISISELDVLSQTWGQYSPRRETPAISGKIQAANLYGQYFRIFLENADIIERVTFWGIYDEHSWRRTGLPLIFEGGAVSRAKPAYYKVIEALEQHRQSLN
ncbi:MAG: endo-1,4-beta-xylanase [Treponema sp.]|nr:endo-1,4-beta-xylanase [Treponema sp.]